MTCSSWARGASIRPIVTDVVGVVCVSKTTMSWDKTAESVDMLTQSCVSPGSLNRVPALAAAKSLCDPTWHVSSRSGVAMSHCQLLYSYTSVYVTLRVSPRNHVGYYKCVHQIHPGEGHMQRKLPNPSMRFLSSQTCQHWRTVRQWVTL